MAKQDDLLKQKKVNGAKFVWIHDNLWRCPKCGGTETLIYDPDCNHMGEYPKEEAEGWMLANDYIECGGVPEDGVHTSYTTRCDFTSTVGKFFNMLRKAQSMVPCPHCRGTGLIKADKKGK